MATKQENEKKQPLVEVTIINENVRVKGIERPVNSKVFVSKFEAEWMLKRGLIKG